MDLIEQAKENASQNYRNGINCAESVLKAVIDTGVTDFSSEIVALATGFGGGMGLTGNNCGALTGGIMAIGTVHGRFNPMEKEFKERIKQLYGNPGLYRFFNGFPHQFKEKFGSLDCKEINKNYTDWNDKERHKKCMKITIETAGLAMEFILLGKEEGFTQSFGANMTNKI
ncbi:MAG: C_GCAxxG_C_C family protein [Desulfobacterales bacterium]|nr:C_GCAxxG_C_C family protein [Desulfobacterales bacterium]